MAIARLYDFTSDYNNDIAIDDRKMEEELDQIVTEVNTKFSTFADLIPNTNDEGLDDALENYLDGCWVGTVDAGAEISVGLGTAMINGRLRRITSNIDTNPGTDPDGGDWLDVWILADAAASTFTVSLVDAGTSPGSSSNPGTNGRLIGAVYHNGSGVYSKVINFRPGEICGWSWIAGDDGDNIQESFTGGTALGVTFDDYPVVALATPLGAVAATPVDIADLTTSLTGAAGASVHNINTTDFRVKLVTEDGTTFASGTNYGYSFIIKGTYS